MLYTIIILTVLSKKQLPLDKFPYQYKNHMFKLHELYISELRSNKKIITKSIVINYVKNLHTAQLMFSLNYHLRNIDKSN